MTVNEDVDYFEEEDVVLPDAIKFAREYANLLSMHNNIKTKLDGVKEKLLAEFPGDPGEYELKNDGTLLRISIGEKFTWDSDILEQLFATKAIPDHVRQTFGVNRKKFEALPEADRAPLLPALTRKPGTIKIEVS